MAGVALAVMLGIVFLPSLFSPAGSLPSILPSDQPGSAAGSAIPPAAPIAAGAVVFTALQPGVWVKFYDAAGTQLLQKELAQGESYTVPAGQGEVLLRTARPDLLAITVGGQPVPKLSDLHQPMKDVPVSAAALLARGSAAQTPASPAPTAAGNTPAPRKAAVAQPREQRIPTPRVEASPAPASLPSTAPTATGPAPAPAAT